MRTRTGTGMETALSHEDGTETETGMGLPYKDRNRDKTTRWDHHTRMRATAQERGRRWG
jgi:hypothetical protein